MLLVKTYLTQSDIHGMGLFSGQKIKKGQEVWRLNSLTTSVFSFDSFLDACKNISFHTIFELIDYSYVRNSKVFFLHDKAKFINHSIHPNLKLVSENIEIALRDIEIGEELTENYEESYDKSDFYFWPNDLSTITKKDTLVEIIENRLVFFDEALKNTKASFKSSR